MTEPAAYVRALRPRQWVKNVLVAAAPIAAGTLDDATVAWKTVGAIAVFIAASAATYVFNDAADVEIDRRHPTKRLRPIASGEISLGHAYVLAMGLTVVATAGAFALAWEFGLVIVAYLAINAWYSTGMKNLAWVELAAVASGFVLRAIGGGAATDTPLSAWFVVVVCGASLFVVAGKRSAELQRTGGRGGRPVLARYSSTSLRKLRAVSAGTSVVAYALWVVAQDVAIGWLAAASLFPFTGALARYSAVIESGQGEDPEDIMLGDRWFQLAVLCWVIVYGLAVYG
ncbi:MAG: decaprenyl-phosphate phosphoribosyltransferase [Acidimicrobiia bacterium]